MRYDDPEAETDRLHIMRFH